MVNEEITRLEKIVFILENCDIVEFKNEVEFPSGKETIIEFYANGLTKTLWEKDKVFSDRLKSKYVFIDLITRSPIKSHILKARNITAIEVYTKSYVFQNNNNLEASTTITKEVIQVPYRGEFKNLNEKIKFYEYKISEEGVFVTEYRIKIQIKKSFFSFFKR
jgi:hypothetical protein